MNADDLPTKKNLLNARQNLTLAKKGHGLLEMKHNALLRELKRTEKTANEIREKLQTLQQKAEHVLTISKMESGEDKVLEIWKNLQWGSAMKKPVYDLTETGASLDEAYILYEEVFFEKHRLAEIEKVLAQLKIRTQRTKKRAAALKNISIPKYEARIKYISTQLEEHERDERIRLRAVSFCPIAKK